MPLQVHENLSGKLSYSVVKDTWETRFDFDEMETKGTLTAVHHFLWLESNHISHPFLFVP